MGQKIDSCKPAVGRRTLLFMGGFVWICVGIMLLGFAYYWLRASSETSPLPFVSTGFVLAILIHHFGFLKIVDRNLGRILPVGDKRCLFGFMPWKSYIIIVIMVGMGRFLRHSRIPKPYLSIVYIGIGLALILSSIRYFRMFIQSSAP